MLWGTRRIFSLACAALFVVSASQDVVWAQQSSATGGFIDSSTGAGLRPTLSAGEIAAFMPSRGLFTFPSPYSTQGVRLTNAGDCGGQDCVLSVGYSYWSNINNHTGSDTMLVFPRARTPQGRGWPNPFQLQQAHGRDAEPRPAVLG
jgi:hypothetical protein